MAIEEYPRFLRPGIARNETISYHEKALCPSGDLFAYHNLLVEGVYRIDGTVLLAGALCVRGRVIINGKLETGGW